MEPQHPIETLHMHLFQKGKKILRITHAVLTSWLVPMNRESKRRKHGNENYWLQPPTSLTHALTNCYCKLQPHFHLPLSSCHHPRIGVFTTTFSLLSISSSLYIYTSPPCSWVLSSTTSNPLLQISILSQTQRGAQTQEAAGRGSL